MISTSSNKVILHIPVCLQTVRFGGIDRKVASFSAGFVDAEYEDGNVFPVTNPLKDWLIDMESRVAGSTQSSSLVYFVFEGDRVKSNPGNDDNGPSITDDQFNANGVA